MIIVRLSGGLGNQMFQYATGRAVAARSGVPLKLDVTAFVRDDNRAFALDGFRIAATVATEAEITRFLGAGYKELSTRLRLRLQRLLPHALRTLIWERGLPYESRLRQVGSSAYLAGYWQSESYFSDIADRLRDELTLFDPPSAEGQAMSAEMQARDSLSVHVRRGDYVSHPLYGGICTGDYYRRAVDSVCRRVPGIHAYLFSDDIAWAEANLDLGCETTYVRPRQGARDHEDIWLMSLCRHHVIANSSFSWWGAWLGKNRAKIVVAPRRWFNDTSRDVRDLVPAAWERI
jgi:hypothetical protein